ncbi:MAG: aminotransferase class V-fold PLP-dependent enzyme [Oscillospiraceae bacterium]|jgi:selenocysteine lyase/cysteine desulfurase|nr:aminotransferase class V-fold PLP-dependent enzyme [Oscillospiraceae bacterium]
MNESKQKKPKYSVYLDSAATSLVRPTEVHSAVRHALKQAASTGRSQHKWASFAQETVFSAREAAAELLGAASPEQIVFTHNATHGLNAAINAIVPRGARVLVSGYEHNSVVRPLYARGCDIMFVRARLYEPELCEFMFGDAVCKAQAVVVNHVSNVFGYRLPVEKISKMCREKNIPLIIDASQSAGSVEVSMEALGADFIAMPGHKGLLGPQGTGVLVVNEKYARDATLATRLKENLLLFGGTGSMSQSREMPDTLPDMFEPGTLNVHGIAGLAAGINYVRSVGTKNILAHELKLLRYTERRLAEIHGVETFSGGFDSDRTGVSSFTLAGHDCEDVAAQLAASGIAVRSGLHCAPVAHETVGTIDTGTVRVSFSPFSRKKDADALISEVRIIAEGK